MIAGVPVPPAHCVSPPTQPPSPLAFTELPPVSMGYAYARGKTDFQENAFVKRMCFNGGMTNGLAQGTSMVWNMRLLCSHSWINTRLNPGSALCILESGVCPCPR